MHLSAPDNFELFKVMDQYLLATVGRLAQVGGIKLRGGGELDTMNKSAKYEKLGKHWS